MELVIGKGADDGDRIDVAGPRTCQFEAGRDGLGGQLPAPRRRRAETRELGLLYGCDQLAVFKRRARGVTENSAYTENDHFRIEPRISANAHE